MQEQRDDNTREQEAPEAPAREWPTSLANPKRSRRA